MKILILAGGGGIRLWPLSTPECPKQFIKLLANKRSLFQETFSRSLLLAGIDDIYVITHEKYKGLVKRDIEELGLSYKESNILLEPEAKNTLPAIYYGIHEIHKAGHDQVVVFPSDHVILKTQAFIDMIKESEQLTQEYLITFGIKPTSIHTGYGYISPGAPKLNGFKVKEFKEKPDVETARYYIHLGYLWNSGVFMFDSGVFEQEMKKYAPHILDAFESSKGIQETFSKIEQGISIDYGVMEKSDKVVTVPIDVGWNDLGSFDSFYDSFDKDINGNITSDSHIIVDSSNNLIQVDSNKKLALIGVEDLIIIDSKDGLLICKKGESQKVKDLCIVRD